ncbi:MAG: branched-chain amino acid ABC transporter permease [Acidimicrobiia bacterium]|nr:branched-chain amino acid ABC transporter permease [Acidimicrobiia bacterium]MYC84808.1 branched-chain amino acid ABC transporter permease [Acidimicrobiia bacterium]
MGRKSSVRSGWPPWPPEPTWRPWRTFTVRPLSLLRRGSARSYRPSGSITGPRSPSGHDPILWRRSPVRNLARRVDPPVAGGPRPGSGAATRQSGNRERPTGGTWPMNWDILGQQIWNGLLNGSIYVIFAAGLSLVFGVMRVINMAHGELTMLGAMLLFTVTSVMGLSYFAGAALVVVMMALAGFLVNRVTVRPFLGHSELVVILSTVALSFILLNGSLVVWGSTPKGVDKPFNEVLQVGGVYMTTAQILLVGVCFTAVLALYLVLTRTKLGKMTRATGQNLLGARLIGINTTAVYDATLIIASGLAALAGVLIVLISAASPNLGQPLLITGFAVVIVAGMGNVGGAVAVGLFLGLTEALFGQYVSTFYRQGYLYVVMIIVLLLRPQGLFGRR